MKEIMREIIRKQMDSFSPEQEGWAEHVANCVGAEICPQCGGNILSYEKSVDKGPRESTFFECTKCDWQIYM